MMISPENYYEEYLSGKDDKQIMTTIRGLKMKWAALRISWNTRIMGLN